MFTPPSLVLEPTNRSELPEYKRQFLSIQYFLGPHFSINEHLIKALHLNSVATQTSIWILKDNCDFLCHCLNINFLLLLCPLFTSREPSGRKIDWDYRETKDKKVRKVSSIASNFYPQSFPQRKGKHSPPQLSWLFSRNFQFCLPPFSGYRERAKLDEHVAMWFA